MHMPRPGSIGLSADALAVGLQPRLGSGSTVKPPQRLLLRMRSISSGLMRALVGSYSLVVRGDY